MRINPIPCLLFLCFATSLSYAGAPIKVCVSDDAGKVAFKSVTQLEAPFVTPDLGAGNYVVQFNATSATLKGHQYLLVISAGKTKVSSSLVTAEKFGGGGVAVRIKVGPGSTRIMGQVARQAVVSDIAFERVHAWQDRGGEGSLRNHHAGEETKMIGQTGRGY